MLLNIDILPLLGFLAMIFLLLIVQDLLDFPWPNEIYATHRAALSTLLSALFWISALALDLVWTLSRDNAPAINSDNSSSSGECTSDPQSDYQGKRSPSPEHQGQRSSSPEVESPFSWNNHLVHVSVMVQVLGEGFSFRIIFLHMLLDDFVFFLYKWFMFYS